MKKKFILILIVVGVLLIPYFLYTLFTSFLSHTPDPASYLSVKELTGIDAIFIDGKQIGTTPFINKEISSGEHSILIRRVQHIKAYSQLNEVIDFQPYTNNFINIQLGPNPPFTFYSIFTLKKTTAQAGIVIKAINTNKMNDDISINDINAKQNEVISKRPGNYKLLFKNPLYLPYTTDITITQGYILEAIIHPFEKPL